MNKTRKFIVSLALLMAMVMGTTVVASASGYKTIPKQNYANSEKDGHTEVEYGDTVKFTLYTKRESDTFAVYNLTEVNLNSSTHNGIVKWNDDFMAWIQETYETADPTAYALYQSPNTLGWDRNGNKNDLTKEAATVQLLRDLRAAMNADATLKANIEKYKVAEYKAEDNKTANVVVAESYNPEADDSIWAGAYEIKDLNFGLYYIDARSSAKTYQPLLVDLVPAQTGPTGHWYVDNTIEATMKYDDLKITKMINGKRADIVRYGEIVNFTVDVQLPHYDNVDSTYVAAFDNMQQGFTLITPSATLSYYDATGHIYHPQTTGLSTDVYGNVKVSDVNKTYSASLCETAYPFYIEGNEHENVLYATPTNTEGLYQFWGEVNGSLVEVGQGALDNASSYSEALNSLNEKLVDAKLPTYPAGSVIRQAEYTKSLISITFDYDKLMKAATYVKDATHAQNTAADADGCTPCADFTIPEGMKVTYQAVINENAYVGDMDEYDVNTNTVAVYYVDDPTGHVGKAEDEVRAWTYASRIIKVDGDKYETFDPEAEIDEATNPDPYLSGAKFSVYRLDTTYCGSNNTDAAIGLIPAGTVLNTEPTTSDYSKYFFLKDTLGYDNYVDARTAWVGQLANYIKYEYTNNLNVFDATTIRGAIALALGANADGQITGSKLDQYNTADIYANKYNKVPGAAATDELKILQNWVLPGAPNSGVESLMIPSRVETCTHCSEPHYHLDAYMVFYDDIVSDGTAEGVVKVGFDDTTYLLVEKEAPTAEGVTYNAMNEAVQYEFIKWARTEGSYAGFKDDEGNEVENGIYDLIVRNYTGLTLPSTGGMGTLLFTLIGLAIMVSVMMIVLIKRRNRVASVASYIAILAILVTSICANTVPAYAQTTIQLGGGNIAKISSDGNTDFKVNLKESTDTIEAYKLAASTWNGTTQSFDGPNWLSGISGRLATIATAIGVEQSQIESPAALGQQDNEVQSAFLNWLYDNRESNALTSSAVATSKITYDGKVATVSNVSYGVYLIKATGANGRSYGLITANAIPTRSGPGNDWTIDSNLTVSLKFSDINVSKTISVHGEDGEKSATVTIGDDVKFEIKADVPSYPAVDENGNIITDSEAIEAYDYSAYEYNFVDTMSSAFAIDRGTLKIQGKTAAGEFEDLASDSYTALFKDAAEAATASSGLMVYQDNKLDGKHFLYADVTYTNPSYAVDWYAYNAETGKLVKVGSSTTAPSATVGDDVVPGLTEKYIKATGLEVDGTFTRTAQTNWKGLQVISYNYQTLREAGITNVRVAYTAKVTDEIQVGSQENNNKATFYYQGDMGGKITSKESTAFAYTYAVQIMKVDGETNTPLADAEFILFQNKYIYVPTDDASATVVAGEYAKYQFAQKAYGDDHVVKSSEAAPVINFGTEEVPKNVTVATFKDLDDNNQSGNRYYYRYVDVAASACDYPGCGKIGGDAHQHIHVYEAMDVDGDGETIFKSVANVVGVTLKGLAARDYALIEVKAPKGYNILTEAVLFKIRELTPEQATALMGADYNLAGFVSDVEIDKDDLAHAADYVTVGEGEAVKYYQAYRDGSYPITIKNFAGIKLPNTGGMGTLLFTILGIGVMTMVMILIVAKNRRKAYEV